MKRGGVAPLADGHERPAVPPRGDVDLIIARRAPVIAPAGDALVAPIRKAAPLVGFCAGRGGPAPARNTSMNCATRCSPRAVAASHAVRRSASPSAPSPSLTSATPW